MSLARSVPHNPKVLPFTSTCVYQCAVQIATDVIYAQGFGFLRRLRHSRRMVVQRCLSPDSRISKLRLVAQEPSLHRLTTLGF